MLVAEVVAIANCALAFLVASVELVLPSSLTDKNAATFQIPGVVVARMVAASVAVVVHVLKQQLTPRGRFTTKGSFPHRASKDWCAVLGKVRAGTVFEGGAAVVSCVWRFMKLAVFAMSC